MKLAYPKFILKHVQHLRSQCRRAQPYFQNSPSNHSWEDRIAHEFPDQPGVYVILRRCALPLTGYRFHGVNGRNPVVLYVGRTSPRRTIARRLRDHFGLREPNYQGSQFAKILLQIIQDESVVQNILWSDDTIIACLSVTGTKQEIDCIANAAIEEFKPRLNVLGR